MEILNPAVAYDAVRNFLNAGGFVLYLIAGVTFWMWAMIIERLVYWGTAHGSVTKRAQRAWKARSDHKSWNAHAVRERLISETKQEAERNNGIIRALVAVTPLFGLLGTVTGMVHLMAAGISKATIPTMAGLVASLSGLIFINAFDSNVQKASNRIADDLLIE